MDAELTVRDVMDREFVGVSEADDVRSVAELLLEEGAECAVVLRGQEPVGLLTERDVLSVVSEGRDPESVAVGDVVVGPVPTVGPDSRVDVAVDEMTTHGSRRLLVAEGEVLGLVTEHDLLSATTIERYDEPVDVETAMNGDALDDDRAVTTDRAISDQSICQECGALSRDLFEDDGRLLCPDCRDV
jgi:CBS domain-containing protein